MTPADDPRLASKTILYLHGYGSTGQAYKAMLLREMFPQCRVVSPTMDYDHTAPQHLYDSIRETAEQAHVDLMVGSSFGGYQALCATTWFAGPVWLVNPVTRLLPVLQLLWPQATSSLHPAPSAAATGSPSTATDEAERRLTAYVDFDREVFARLPRRENQLHFALSTDDETLGNHAHVPAMFPHAAQIVWMADCGHRCLRFAELRADMAASLLRT
ncbi:MAG: alpha/beta hydrolase [Bacteroidales bacterium]|nr:alpha/beta hydrolase [Bacteroidales bacterium]